ncbi:hypothetical protein KVT40_009332 [Elsinoe batatas]|uniref:Uncharacterized protein n=1 Tax=Elsinoe batatas TaxID=2601811 RepID=A0A8K0KVM0_9PEZI|nr:hypothetical protein KVT40_009332 [Elsinoe batatas]
MSLPPRPTRSLAGTVSLVTGAGSAGEGIGNGRAAALLLAEAGSRVVCVDISLEDGERTRGMVEDEGGTALALQVDVTDEAQCRSAVQRTIEAFGRLDILVNNVGIGGAAGTAVSTDKDDWARGLEVNVTSMMLIRFLAGDEARWMTGVILPVDAGTTCATQTDLPRGASVNP